MLAVLQRIYRAAMKVLTSAELLHKLGNKQVSFPEYNYLMPIELD